VNRLHPLQFTKYNASGGLIWATTFGIGGYVLGQNIRLSEGRSAGLRSPQPP
jgi:membrane protein DedA with SNARE-associated domain